MIANFKIKDLPHLSTNQAEINVPQSSIDQVAKKPPSKKRPQKSPLEKAPFKKAPSKKPLLKGPFKKSP